MSYIKDSISYFRGKLSNNLVPSWIILNIDIFISAISFIMAYFLRFNFHVPQEYLNRVFPALIIIVLVKSIGFFLGKTYVNIIRYTSIRDLFKLITVMLGCTAFLMIANFIYYLSNAIYFLPISILIIDFFISAYIVVFVRMSVKIFFSEIKGNASNKQPAIIFGSEELAISVKRAFDMDVESTFKFIAFVDYEKDTNKKKIEGLEIYNYKKLEHIIRYHGVKTLIIAKTHIPPALKNTVVEKCLKLNVKVMSVNNIKNWIKGGIDVKQIKNIKIEDLLERDPITLDSTEISKQLANKTILVTGAAGSIGSEIVRQISSFNPYKVILLDQAETPLHNIELEIAAKSYNFRTEIFLADIANPNKLKVLFESHHIDVIYHAAAYKHVPMMEKHPSEAVKNNIYGTKLLADFAVKYKVAKFVMISTDKAVNPTNVMGASKRIAEIYTQSLNEFGGTSFITTRFGNVLGSNGSVIPLFKKQIEAGEVVTVTDPEVCRFFMTIPEACQLVLEASVMGKGGEIFIFDMGKSVKIADLAKKMIRLSGLELGKDIEIRFTGLRPGEKIYEELLNDSENTLPTHHPKIMIARVAENNHESIEIITGQLIEAVARYDNYEIVRIMKKMVPEFKSSNSPYEVLDKEQSG